jgi:hypothetical protein
MLQSLHNLQYNEVKFSKQTRAVSAYIKSSCDNLIGISSFSWDGLAKGWSQLLERNPLKP